MLKSERKIEDNPALINDTIKQEYELYCDFCYVEHESLSDLNSCLQKQLASIKQETTDDRHEKQTSYETINDLKPLITCITKEEEVLNQTQESQQLFAIKEEVSIGYREESPQTCCITKEEKIVDVAEKTQQKSESTVQYFHCTQCDKNYKSKKTLGVHIKTHNVSHASKRPEQNCYICDFCGKVFEVRKGVLEHLRFHLNGHHRCNYCGVEFMLKSSLSRHIQRKHRTSCDKTLQDLLCAHCDKKFQYKESLKFHLNSHRSLSLFTCKDCCKSFNSLGALKIHELSYHSLESNFECKVCLEKFTTYSKLVSHRKKHSRKSLEEHPCNECSFTTTDRKSLKKHQLNTHQKQSVQELEFPCAECDKKFAQKRYLQNHYKRMHAGVQFTSSQKS